MLAWVGEPPEILTVMLPEGVASASGVGNCGPRSCDWMPSGTVATAEVDGTKYPMWTQTAVLGTLVVEQPFWKPMDSPVELAAIQKCILKRRPEAGAVVFPPNNFT